MEQYGSIYEAIEENDIVAVECFLKNGNYDEMDGGWNPLHAASKAGHKQIVQLILNYVNQGQTSFHINSYFEIMDDYSDDRGSALSEALLNKNFSIANILIKNGANINESYYSQSLNSPEYLFADFDAATKGGVCWWLADKKLFKVMKKMGIEADAQDFKDNTALFYAVSNANNEYVDILLDLGADPNQYVEHDCSGQIPILVYAVMQFFDTKKSDYLETIKLLLKYGALLNLTCYQCDQENVMDLVFDADCPELDEIFGLSRIKENMKGSTGQVNHLFLDNSDCR